MEIGILLSIVLKTVSIVTVVFIELKLKYNGFFSKDRIVWYINISEKEGCKSIQVSPNVNGLYYKNGHRAKADSDTHLPGTVIYPKCKEGSYPNVKEAVCMENGEWDIDYLECLREYFLKSYRRTIYIHAHHYNYY